MKNIIAFSLFIAATTAFADQPTTPLWLIVGGTRGTGYALATELSKTNAARCTLFVRDSAKAKALFANAPYKPTIIEGEAAAENDLTKLKEAAQGASYIVIATLFPYKVWANSFPAMITNCIAVAQETNATLIYYGRIQRYGLINPITENSVAQPNSSQGIIFDAMEKLLEECTARTVLITHSYPFGPNVGDGLLEKNFINIPLNKNKSWYQSKQKFEWIGSNTVELQFTYLPDLARFTQQLVAALPAEPTELCTRVNFAGLTVPTIDTFGQAYATIAQLPYEPSLFSNNMLTFASQVSPDAQRALDVFYSFTNVITLDATKQQALYPFELTPLNQALQETYDAYATAQ